MRIYLTVLFASALVVIAILGFRGDKSEKPPLWLFPDMDEQAKYKAQAANDYFSNRMNDRPVPRNTILRGQGFDRGTVFGSEYDGSRVANTELLRGREADGEWVRGFPTDINEQVMRTGEEKYQIFCLPCHGHAGDGRGVTSQYGILASNLNLEMYRVMAEGEIYNTIAYGKGTMMGYAEKLNPEERWAVVLYVRALQRSQNASAGDIPSDKKAELGL
ncbi:MAG: c-type cytochrome [Puniceicoccaceae bacterium]